MNCCFRFKERRVVTSANKYVYVKPAMHPKRCLNEHDFVYILEGDWQIGIENQTYYVKKDDVIILPANMFHYGLKRCAENTKIFAVHTALSEGDGCTTEEPPSLTNTKCCLPFVVNAASKPEIKNMFSDIIFSYKHGSDLKASMLFNMLLLALFEACEEKGKGNIAFQIKNIIDNNLHRTINTAYISEKLNISIKTAEKKFKQTYNSTIHQYALTQKLLLAKEYLELYPDMKIYEIAINLGFYDEYHFSHRYKKHFGISPNNYRKSINKNE